MRKPNVVGAAEAAEILGVEVQRISRWGDKMPTPAVKLAATKVWHRVDIERFRDGKPITRPANKVVLDLVSTSEAADIIGVNKSQIGRWRRGGKFPRPCIDLKAGPLWWREQIEAFKAAR